MRGIRGKNVLSVWMAACIVLSPVIQTHAAEIPAENPAVVEVSGAETGAGTGAAFADACPAGEAAPEGAGSAAPAGSDAGTPETGQATDSGADSSNTNPATDEGTASSDTGSIENRDGGTEDSAGSGAADGSAANGGSASEKEDAQKETKDSSAADREKDAESSGNSAESSDEDPEEPEEDEDRDSDDSEFQDIALQIMPNRPSETGTGGVWQVTVSAANPNAEAQTARIYLWKYDSRFYDNSLRNTIETASREVSAAGLSSDGRFVAADRSGAGGAVEVWLQDVGTARYLEFTLPGQSACLFDIPLICAAETEESIRVILEPAVAAQGEAANRDVDHNGVVRHDEMNAVGSAAEVFWEAEKDPEADEAENETADGEDTVAEDEIADGEDAAAEDEIADGEDAAAEDEIPAGEETAIEEENPEEEVQQAIAAGRRSSPRRAPAAAAESELVPGVETEVDVEGRTIMYLPFTPTVTHDYTFTSLGTVDTIGYLCDENKAELATDDDSAGNEQFRLTYELEAGKTYYWGVRYYASGSSGPVRVLLERAEHTWELTETVEATETGEGYNRFVCKYGDDSKQEILPTTGLEPDVQKTVTLHGNSTEYFFVFRSEFDHYYTITASSDTAENENNAGVQIRLLDGDRNNLSGVKTGTADQPALINYHIESGETYYIGVKYDSAQADGDVRILAQQGRHVYTAETTTPPTAAEGGTLTYTCTCGDTYTSELPANAITPGVAREVRLQAACAEVFYEFVPAYTHKYTVGVETDETDNIYNLDMQVTVYNAEKEPLQTAVTRSGAASIWDMLLQQDEWYYIGVQYTNDSVGSVNYQGPDGTIYTTVSLGQHTFTSIVTKEPTLTEDGERTICVCGYETEILPAKELAVGEKKTVTRHGGDSYYEFFFTPAYSCSYKFTAETSSLAYMTRNYYLTVADEEGNVIRSGSHISSSTAQLSVTQELEAGRTYGVRLQYMSNLGQSQVGDLSVTVEENHSYTCEIKKLPTADDLSGIRTYTCSVCGHSYDEPFEVEPLALNETKEAGKGTPDAPYLFMIRPEETHKYEISDSVIYGDNTASRYYYLAIYDENMKAIDGPVNRPTYWESRKVMLDAGKLYYVGVYYAGSYYDLATAPVRVTWRERPHSYSSTIDRMPTEDTPGLRTITCSEGPETRTEEFTVSDLLLDQTATTPAVHGKDSMAYFRITPEITHTYDITVHTSSAQGMYLYLYRVSGGDLVQVKADTTSNYDPYMRDLELTAGTTYWIGVGYSGETGTQPISVTWEKGHHNYASGITVDSLPTYDTEGSRSVGCKYGDIERTEVLPSTALFVDQAKSIQLMKTTPTVEGISKFTFAFRPERTHLYTFDVEYASGDGYNSYGQAEFLDENQTRLGSSIYVSDSGAGHLTGGKLLEAGRTYYVRVSAYSMDGTFTVTPRMTPHSESDEYETLQEPTCLEPGTIRYHCAYCEETFEKEVPALGHDFDQDGVCTRCGLKQTDCYQLTIRIISAQNGQTLPADGIRFQVRYADGVLSENGGNKTYSYALWPETFTDNGDGTYTLWFDKSCEVVDGRILFLYAGTESSRVHTEYYVMGGAYYRSLEEAKDGRIEQLFLAGESGGFSPIYIEAYTYDSVTGRPAAGGKIRLEFSSYAVDGLVTWAPYNSGTLYEVTDGHYYYTTGSGAPASPASIGAQIGYTLRGVVTKAPEGYTTELDAARSVDTYTVQNTEYYTGFKGPYTPGDSNNWVYKLYMKPQAMIRALVVDSRDSRNDATNYRAVPYDSWELYADAACTTPVTDAEGRPIGGSSSMVGVHTYAVSYTEWFDYDWAAYGTTAYVRLTGVEEKYTDDGTYVAAVSLEPARKFTESSTNFTDVLNNLILTPRAIQVPLRVTVTNMEQPVSGRTVQVYAYDVTTSDYEEEPLGTLTDNGDGTYSGISLTQTNRNRGEFRIKDAGTGVVRTIRIAGKESVETTLDISPTGDLITILKKDESGAYIGNIDLIYNDEILDSTNPEKEKAITDPIPGDSKITVSLYELAVDETLVEDNRIYTYALPEELVPLLQEADGSLGSDWLYLERSGRVRSYGRIVQQGDRYIFQVYFVDTAEQYDIYFGYRYDAAICDDIKKTGGEVRPSWIEKTLQFAVEEPDKEPQIVVTKTTQWVKDSDHTQTGSVESVYSVISGGGVYNTAKYTISIQNKTGRNLTMDLHEALANGMAISRSYSNMLLFEVYLDRGDGLGLIRQNLSIDYSNSMSNYMGNFGPVYTNYAYSGSGITVRAENPSGYGPNGSYVYSFDGLNIYIRNMQCEEIQIVYYADTYYTGEAEVDGMAVTDTFYSTSNGYMSHQNGRNFAVYRPETTITDVSAMNLDTDDVVPSPGTGVTAAALKNYGSLAGRLTMTQNNTYTGGAVNGGTAAATGGDWTGRVNFTYTGMNSGGEHWYVFEETPFGPDWYNGPQDASQNYYFHAADFASILPTNQMPSYPLRNSLDLTITDGSGNRVTPLTRSSVSNSISNSNMANFDQKSYRELQALLRDSGYAGRNDLRCYMAEVTLNGRSRMVWVVVSPETTDLANWDVNFYGGVSAILTQTKYKTFANTGKDVVIPAGIKLYVLGLDGNETLQFTYSKYQRTLTPSYGPVSMAGRDSIYFSFVKGSASNTSQYVGGWVHAYNRVNQTHDLAYNTDTGADSLVTQTGELLADGSVRWILTLDVDKLKFYRQNGGNYFNASMMRGDTWIYVKVPNGYTLSTDYGYDSNFMPDRNGSYRGGLLYMFDKDGNAASQSRSIFNSVYAPNTTVPNYVTGVNYGAVFGTETLINSDYIQRENGKNVIKFMYIMSPSGSGNSLSAGSVYGASELIVPWNNANYGMRFLDAVASSYVSVPSVGSKSLSRKSEQNADEWTSTIRMSNMFSSHWTRPDGSTLPYFLNGTASLYDHMKDMTVYDADGEKLAIADAAKYMQLKSLTVHLTRYGGETQDITLEIADGNVVASALKDGLVTLFTVGRSPKFGWRRYQTVDGSVTVQVDYAPDQNWPDARTEYNGIRYGGENYGMYGGFELNVSGIQDASDMYVNYTMEFDHAAFAAAHPELGVVTFGMTNTAKRNYTGVSGDRNEVTARGQSWSLAVSPDMTKVSREKDRSADYYTNTFLAEADVGAAPQESVSVIDQIAKMELVDRQGNIIPFSNDISMEKVIAQWLTCFTVGDLTVTAKNRIDESMTEVIATLDSADGKQVFADGGRLSADLLEKESADWVIEDADVPAESGVTMAEFADAQALNGNVFSWKIRRNDGTPIPEETYFEIRYTLELQSERTEAEQGNGTTEFWTPFRHLGLAYPGHYGILLTNQIAICYQGSKDLSDDSEPAGARLRGPRKAPVSGTVTTDWAAAGANATARYLQFNDEWKEGDLHQSAEDDDPKQQRQDVTKFRWSLINQEWTTGTNEYAEHRWTDTMYVSALLDSTQVSDPEHAALGDHVLNAAWINLYYKYLTVTGWDVTVQATTGTTDPYQTGTNGKTLRPVSSPDANTLVFEDENGLRVTIALDALEARGDGTWRIRKNADSYTDLSDPSDQLIDLWQIGRYYQGYGYLTEEEKASLQRANVYKEENGKYGYGSVRLFTAKEEHVDHLQTVVITYHAEIDWVALFREAAALSIAEDMLTYARAAGMEDAWMAVAEKAVEDQKALDAASQNLGLTGEDALKIGLYDLPRYDTVMNKGETEEDVHWTNSAWKYAASASGGMSKTVVENEDGSLAWEIALHTGKGQLANVIVKDTLEADESSTRTSEEIANSRSALPYVKLTGFEIRDGEDKVLYTFAGDVFDEASIGSVAGVFDNGRVTFGTAPDDLLTLAFERILPDQMLKIRYTTALDREAWIDRGGDPTTNVVLKNSADAAATGLHLEAETTGTYRPENGQSVEKYAVEGGELGEARWTVEAHTGAVHAVWLQLTDELSVPEAVKAYMSISRMKVTQVDPDGTETVLFDSEEGIDELESRHFRFAEGFALHENGTIGYLLQFNVAQSDGTSEEEPQAALEDVSLAANTTIRVDYTTTLDEEAYLYNGGETENTYTLQNSVFLARDGFPSVQTGAESEIGVREPASKRGSVIGTDSDGYYRTRWTAEVYFNELYAEEELRRAVTATITDTLPSLSEMQYVDDSVHLYELHLDGSTGVEIPAKTYTVETKGRRIVITLNDPGDYPMIRLQLETVSPPGAQGLTNSLDVSILDRTAETTSPEITPTGSRRGYVRSLTRTGEVELTKVDAGDSEKTLEGAAFALYVKNSPAVAGSEDNWTAMPCLIKVPHGSSYLYEYEEDYSEEHHGMEYWQTDLVTDDGGTLAVIGLPFGEYRLVETKAPAGYSLPEEPVERRFTVDRSAFTDESPQVALFEFEIGNVPASFRVYKYFSETHRRKERTGAIAEAGLAIWNADKTEKLYEGTTDEEGCVTFSYVPRGSYILSEETVPGGFEAAADIHFSVDDNGELTDIDEGCSGIDAEGNLYIRMRDEVKKNNLKIALMKTDEETQKPLEKAVFGLFAAETGLLFEADELLDAVSTDREGQAEFEILLPPGKYYVRELEAPEGYVLSKERHEVVLEGDADEETVFRINVKNTPEPPITPEPTETPEPPITPEPTETPAPTVTPEATVSPAPTTTPASSVTPKPTANPAPTVTPAAGQGSTTVFTVQTGDPTDLPRMLGALFGGIALLIAVLFLRKKLNR